jgi:hypothetical protein
MQSFSLESHGITVGRVLRNASPALLYEEALRNEPGTAVSSTGALIALSGAKTGRSPKDKRVVGHEQVLDDVWWGDVNVSLEDRVFDITRRSAVDYLSTRDQLYVIDGFAGWDENYRVKVRIICERAYHALFMRNMLIRPTAEQQRRPLPGQPDAGWRRVFDQRQPLPGAWRVRDPRYRIRRRDEEGRVHDHELPDAQERRAVDALLVQRGSRRRRQTTACSTSRVAATPR